MGDWLVFIGYRFGAGLLGVLPEWCIRRMGAFGGWLSWLWAGDRKRMAIRHMRRVLGPDADAAAAGRRMFAAYGRYWAETFWYRPGRYESIRRHVRLDGIEHLHAAMEGGHGAIVALPHVGNWEMAATAATTVDVKVTAVAEALGNERVTQWFLDVRESLGIDVVLTNQPTGVMRALLEAVRTGNVVALLSDRDLSGRGIEVEFFGERTTLPAGPAALAVRTGAAIVPVASFFERGRGHHIVLEPALEVPADGTTEARVAVTTQRLADALERLVRLHPEQWHLVQPNWPSDHLDES